LDRWEISGKNKEIENSDTLIYSVLLFHVVGDSWTDLPLKIRDAIQLQYSITIKSFSIDSIRSMPIPGTMVNDYGGFVLQAMATVHPYWETICYSPGRGENWVNQTGVESFILLNK